jgi:very-short-patch-repair endonuclease
MDARKLTVTRARALRREMTKPEVILWLALRGGQTGLRFRRQHPIGWYILDFYCREARLAVEVDGGTHFNDEQEAYDQRRDAWLARQGVRVLRLPAADVMADVTACCHLIVGAATPVRGRPAGSPTVTS